MRSRWLADLLPAAAGAAVEGAWTGALGALVTGGHGAAYIGGASAAAFGGAVLAMRTGAGREPDRRARLTAVAYTVAVAACSFVAGHGWQGRPLLGALGAVVYAALLVLLGISLGRERISSDPAFRRAVRGFLLLCGLLAIAAAAGSTPAWAAAAVVVSLVAGVLSVTAARAASTAAAAPGDDRPGTWRWVLAVLGILVLVVAAGALLSLVLRTDVLLWLLAVGGHVLQYLLQLLGFALGWAGAGILRALAWVLGLVHLHGLPSVEPPKSAAAHIRALPKAPTSDTYAWTRLVLTVAAAAAVLVVPLLLVALALRRVRGAAPGDVAEERETVLTLREASSHSAARLRGRLARLLARRRPPASPAEQVRRDYAALEHRLARAGHPRPEAVTVRVYLLALAARAQERTEVTACETAPRSGEPPTVAPSTSGPAELASLYERARYSGAGVDAAAAGRFRDLAQAFTPPEPTRA